ncbi:hypothetical protein CERZMDRAFT_86759 [Cercospora zeae-maydis SCOH1-5]|uniref:SURP motif domain-containing protein n=1 Tax=Cercospora zeae-maydis SCOH1-5 TaxID=717836 RepID=A0A6A6F8T2_9PEZI|nr:hypothetical protein CERZMDRAFT_86759 [Cercospora zeae-maydis SCOH1-5]
MAPQANNIESRTARPSSPSFSEHSQTTNTRTSTLLCTSAHSHTVNTPSLALARAAQHQHHVQPVKAKVSAKKALEKEDKERCTNDSFARAYQENKAKYMAKEREAKNEPYDVFRGGMPQDELATQWPGFVRQPANLERGSMCMPAVYWDSKTPSLQSSTGPHNKNRVLPVYPELCFPRPSTTDMPQGDTFTDFAPGKNSSVPTSNGKLTSSTSYAGRKPLLTSGQDAFCESDDDTWSSVLSRNHSEFELTPEPTPEHEDDVSSQPTDAPPEARKFESQPGSASMDPGNAPRKPVYAFVPLRETPPMVNSDKVPSTGAALSIPVGDVADRIEKVASFVARRGPHSEDVVRYQNHSTSKTRFLEQGHIHHTYSKWRVAECKAGRARVLAGEEVHALDPVLPEPPKTWVPDINSHEDWCKVTKGRRCLHSLAKFQVAENIGQPADKLELHFLADCVEQLPISIRLKAATVVAKLRCNGIQSSPHSSMCGEKEDVVAEIMQKFEADLNLIKGEHMNPESALPKRTGELESKQGCIIPDVTATQLNTIYDKLGDLIDQRMHERQSGRKPVDNAQQMHVANLQQRIAALEQKQASQPPGTSAARMQEFEAKHAENVSGLQERIEELEDSDAKHRTVAEVLLKRVEDLQKKMSVQI